MYLFCYCKFECFWSFDHFIQIFVCEINHLYAGLANVKKCQTDLTSPDIVYHNHTEQQSVSHAFFQDFVYRLATT